MSSPLRIAVAKGDGIGPEIMNAVLKIFDAAKVPLTYSFVDMGLSIYKKGFGTGMTPEAQKTVEEVGILFKGPMETPKGTGVKSMFIRFLLVRCFPTTRLDVFLYTEPLL